MELFPDEVRDDAERLRRAYLRLALVHHPDKQAPEHQQSATASFQRIQAAYEQLDARLKGPSAGGRPAAPRTRVRTVLGAACELGDAAEVHRLLKKRPQDVFVADDLGVLPLMFAARSGALEVCRLLLEVRAEVDAKNPIGWTALTWAALHERVDVVRLLLEHGATISDQMLVIVTWTGNAAALSELLAAAGAERARELRTEQSGQSLLHLAVGGLAYEKTAPEAHIRCIDQLLALQCDVNAVEANGHSVLQHYIADRHWMPENLQGKPSHLRAIRRLCEARADPDARTGSGETAVEMAERGGQRRLRRELLRARSLEGGQPQSILGGAAAVLRRLAECSVCRLCVGGGAAA